MRPCATPEAHFGRPIGILCDLQGPKFRVGNIGGERVPLAEGATFRFDTDGERRRGRARVPAASADLRGGGARPHAAARRRQDPHASSTEKRASSIDANVLVGGTLASRKGISLPDTVLPIGPLTDKDKKDLDFALRLGVDWVALSFVQRGEDVKLARQLVGQAACADVEDREAGGDRRPRRASSPTRTG